MLNVRQVTNAKNVTGTASIMTFAGLSGRVLSVIVEGIEQLTKDDFFISKGE